MYIIILRYEMTPDTFMVVDFHLFVLDKLLLRRPVPFPTENRSHKSLKYIME